MEGGVLVPMSPKKYPTHKLEWALRINETRQTGAVANRTYRVGLNAVRLEIASTVPDKSGSKPRGESVYLFLEFTINP